MPAVLDTMEMAVTHSTGFAVLPISEIIWGTVGINVGMTTPEVEENQDRTPAVIPRMLTAVESFITAASSSDRRSIPPVRMITFISTPTPQIRSSVPQGIRLMASVSSETWRNESTAATAKLARPTFTWKRSTRTTIHRIPVRVTSWYRLKEGMSVKRRAVSDFRRYPPKNRYTREA